MRVSSGVIPMESASCMVLGESPLAFKLTPVRRICVGRDWLLAPASAVGVEDDATAAVDAEGSVLLIAGAAGGSEKNGKKGCK